MLRGIIAMVATFCFVGVCVAQVGPDPFDENDRLLLVYISKRDVAKAKVLIKSPYFIPNRVFSNGYSRLRQTVISGCEPEIARELIAHGEKPHGVTETPVGGTTLMNILNYNFPGCDAVMKIYLDAGGNPDDVMSNYPRDLWYQVPSIFWVAGNRDCHVNNLEKLKELRRHGVNVNARSPKGTLPGSTPLIFYARADQCVPYVKELLNSSYPGGAADINATMPDGSRAIDTAICTGAIQMVSLLKSAGSAPPTGKKPKNC